MKISTGPVSFQPVVLTLESAGELRFLRDVLANTTDAVDRAYGMEPSNVYGLYLTLDTLCEDRNIEAIDSVTIKITKE